MKIGLEALAGKRITTVLFAEDRPGRRMRVFLCFADGGSFEFSGESFDWSVLLENAKTRVLGYVESGQGEVFRAYPDLEDPLPASEALHRNEREIRPGGATREEAPLFQTPEEMEAWATVKVMVAKAKSS